MSLRSILIGSLIETIREKYERFSKTMGLAVFSSDPLSSVAYGTEEILFTLSVPLHLKGYVMLFSYGLDRLKLLDRSSCFLIFPDSLALTLTTPILYVENKSGNILRRYLL